MQVIIIIIITWNTIIHSHKLEVFLVQVLCRSDAMKSCVLSVSLERPMEVDRQDH